MNFNYLFIQTVIPYFLLLIYFLICCYSDIKTKTISLYVTTIFFFIGTIFNIINSNYIFPASILIGIILLIISFLFSNSLGKGDGAMLIICGVFLDFYDTLTVLFYGLLTASVFSFFIMIKKHTKNYSFPFAPFLLISYITILIIKLLKVI